MMLVTARLAAIVSFILLAVIALRDGSTFNGYWAMLLGSVIGAQMTVKP